MFMLHLEVVTVTALVGARALATPTRDLPTKTL
jgi:hypothetical protein